jgi:hypothetical protein
MEEVVVVAVVVVVQAVTKARAMVHNNNNHHLSIQNIYTMMKVCWRRKHNINVMVTELR